MTSISGLGSRQLDAWMVGKLFKTNDQTEPTSQDLASSSAIQLTGETHIGSNVSGGTAQAIMSLKNYNSTGQDVSTSSDRFFIPGGQLKSITQSNAIIKSNQAMTSDQINAAMYDKGLATAGNDVDSPNTTFSDIIANEQSSADYQFQRSKDMSLSEDERQDALVNATQGQNFINSIQNAYDNHTLKFQNASDIAGLDYSQTITYLGNDPNKAADVGVVGSESYNHSFYENRPNKDNSRMLDSGTGIMLYVTW